METGNAYGAHVKRKNNFGIIFSVCVMLVPFMPLASADLLREITYFNLSVCPMDIGDVKIWAIVLMALALVTGILAFCNKNGGVIIFGIIFAAISAVCFIYFHTEYGKSEDTFLNFSAALYDSDTLHLGAGFYVLAGSSVGLIISGIVGSIINKKR